MPNVNVLTSKMTENNGISSTGRNVCLIIFHSSASPFEIGARAEALVLANGVDSSLGIVTSKIYNP